eukprot:TRINITY_DN1796_c0_g1_i2.p1 TRINITY_DN1796_c0_g1~~TRINITY_DN1796_c0_g1_i2.p1  ORF type:complete len:331 (+),score=59.33 TRINITY_DN1796_c0_g1_i2:469-1461(+)
MHELRGTGVYEMTSTFEDTIGKQYNEYRSLFEINGEIPEKISLKHYKWALGIAWSRCFQLANSTSTSAERKNVGFIPFADMLNYQPDPLSWGEFVDSHYQISTTGTIELGEEVFFQYGEKGNYDFLSDYGFIVENNRNSSVTFDLYLSNEDPYWQEKLAIISGQLTIKPYTSTDSKKGRWFEVPLRRTDPHFQENGNASTMLHFLRILFSTTPQELMKATYSAEFFISRNNELKSLEKIIKMCTKKINKYPSTVEDDKKILKEREGELNFNEQNAIKFRLEEKEILMSALEKTERYLRQNNDNTALYRQLLRKQGDETWTSPRNNEETEN